MRGGRLPRRQRECRVGAAIAAALGLAAATDLRAQDNLALAPPSARWKPSALTAGASWDGPWQSALGARGRLSGYHEVSVGRWRADRSGGTAVVTQFAFTLLLRHWPAFRPVSWFAETAVGINALTPLCRSGNRRFSTAFNFGDHVAIGHRGKGREWTLRYQHFSNGGIKRPNPGEHVVQLRAAIAPD